MSPATVSRVLNADPTLSVGSDKRQAIIETAQAMNYTTQASRVGKKLGTIAIVHYLDLSDELNDPYYVGVRLGIESRCKALRLETVKVYPDQLKEQRTALQVATGAIVIGHHLATSPDWHDRFGDNVVYADWAFPIEGRDTVYADLQRAMVNLLNSLEEMAYFRIAYVGSIDQIAQGDSREEARYRAYLDWATKRGLEESLCAVAEFASGGREQLGQSLTRRLLGLPQPPDVIVTFNDNMALGAYRAIDEAGLRIPRDIAVASFNDISAARFLNPPLSTVHVPAEEIGETAVDLLAERLRGRKIAKSVALSTDMIWRESTRHPKNLR